MSWQIWDSSGGIGAGIVLPVGPEKVTIKYGAQVKEIITPGGSIVISYGAKGPLMVWTGKLAEANRTSAYLETQYINYLISKIHSEVWIVAPDTRYDATWVVKGFEFNEDKGVVNMFTYKLEFMKGIQAVVL